MIATTLALLSQMPVPGGWDVKDYLNGGFALLMLGVLTFVVRVLQQTSKENAERAVAAQKACDDRQEKTVATVDGICDRFASTVQAIVKEHRDERGRLEERLLDELRDARKTG